MLILGSGSRPRQGREPLELVINKQIFESIEAIIGGSTYITAYNSVLYTSLRYPLKSFELSRGHPPFFASGIHGLDFLFHVSQIVYLIIIIKFRTRGRLAAIPNFPPIHRWWRFVTIEPRQFTLNRLQLLPSEQWKRMRLHKVALWLEMTHTRRILSVALRGTRQRLGKSLWRLQICLRACWKFLLPFGRAHRRSQRTKTLRNGIKQTLHDIDEALEYQVCHPIRHWLRPLSCLLATPHLQDSLQRPESEVFAIRRTWYDQLRNEMHQRWPRDPFCR